MGIEQWTVTTPALMSTTPASSMNNHYLLFNPLFFNVMKIEMEHKNKENYVSPELEVLELTTERVLGDSSTQEEW